MLWRFRYLNVLFIIIIDYGKIKRWFVSSGISFVCASDSSICYNWRLF